MDANKMNAFNSGLNDKSGTSLSSHKINNNLHQFLETFRVAEKGGDHTHIVWSANAKQNGKYLIPPNALDNFMSIYKFNLENDLPLGIVEKHRDIGPVVVDLDFKHTSHKRQYTWDNIQSFIHIYHETISQFIQMPNNDIRYFVMSKQQQKPYNNEFKDGIHMVCPDIVTRPLIQFMVREHVLKRWNEIFDTCFTNDPQDIYDEAIIERNGWFMYGSKKPNEAESYKVDAILVHYIDVDDFDQEDLHYSPSELVDILSIRNKYDETPERLDKHEEIENFRISKMKKEEPHLTSSKNVNVNHVSDNDYAHAQVLVQLLSPTRADNYKEWVELGWCLRNIDCRLLGCWIDFSKQSSKFKDGECEKLWNYMKSDGLKLGTLHFWAKNDNPEKYAEATQNELREYIRAARSGTEYDVARVIHKMYNGMFAFEADEWYIFRFHRWHETDKGLALLKVMPTEVANEFRRNAAYYATKATETTDAEEKDRLDGLVGDLQSVVKKLKKAPFQASVLTECKMFFDHENFIQNLDEKKFLIGLKNGVYDLKAKEFRAGKPDDMITLCRGHNFVDDDHAIQKEILDFIYGITPNKQVGDYVLGIHAYSLSGYKYEETGFIYSGIGRSDKGTLRDLVAASSGDYYWEPTITILTAIKNNSSSASPELRVLKGKRDMFMLEPESGNEKIMISIWKKIVGLDKITCRDLYETEVSFKPQFTPIIQCNAKIGLSKFETNLDTKISIVDFPYKHVRNPKLDYERNIDTTLKEKFENNPAYAEQWFNILLRYYYEQGIDKCAPLTRPHDVEESTSEYFRENNPFGVWLQEWWTLEPQNEKTKISAKEMCDHYNYDMEMVKPIKVAEFGRLMSDNGYRSKKYNGTMHYYGFKRNEEKEKERESQQGCLIQSEDEIDG